MSGLYLVTTPIGNNLDFTKRAIAALEKADLIYCEDTRVFRLLAKACEIDLTDKKIDSFHDHSNELKVKRILENAQTKNCAFVSDAGSPLLSDPAFPLVKMAIEKEIELYSCGGISSPIVALELSGLPPIPFHFHGFLARDKSKKNKDFQMISQVYGTHIFFEGVSRVLKTLDEITSLYPQFEFAVARELTKEYESVYRFRGSEFSEIKSQIMEKGEFIILIYNPNKDKQEQNNELIAIAEEILTKGTKTKIVAKLVAHILDQNVKDIYQQLNLSK